MLQSSFRSAGENVLASNDTATTGSTRRLSGGTNDGRTVVLLDKRVSDEGGCSTTVSPTATVVVYNGKRRKVHDYYDL